MSEPTQPIKTLKIPSLPSVVARVCSMVDDPEVGIWEVGEAIAEDPAITANVLRMANSATYGLQREVGTPGEAATVVGARALRDLTLQAVVMDEFDHLVSDSAIDVRALWKHDVIVAHVGKQLARKSRAATKPAPDDVYTCGLLHDLGRLVLLDNLRLEYTNLLAEADAAGQPRHELEAAKLGTTHMEVGATVIESWKLPVLIEDVARRHHDPLPENEGCTALSLVLLADAVADAALSGDYDVPESLLESVPSALELPKAKVFEVYEWAVENSSAQIV